MIQLALSAAVFDRQGGVRERAVNGLVLKEAQADLPQVVSAITMPERLLFMGEGDQNSAARSATTPVRAVHALQRFSDIATDP